MTSVKTVSNQLHHHVDSQADFLSVSSSKTQLLGSGDKVLMTKDPPEETSSSQSADVTEHLQYPISARHVVNSDGNKFSANEPNGDIFDGLTAGRALSIRSSCYYPGSIIDQMRSNRLVLSEISSKADRSRHVAAVPSEPVAPPAVINYGSSTDDSEENRECKPDVAEVVHVIHNAARTSETAPSNTQHATSQAKSSGSEVPQAEKKIVRKQKMTELPSSTETDSDEESLSTYVAKTKTSCAKPRKHKKKLTVNLGGTRYDVVRDMIEYLGFTICEDENQNCFLVWTDATPSNEKIAELKPYQRINHFPGMGEICRKDSLARNMAKMSKVFPLEFNFMPKTWILPSEYANLQSYSMENRKNRKKCKTFIIKPANGAMGNGIQLVRYVERIPSHEHIIVQEYIEKPLLVDGFKCDLRIYVLITSCSPLRVFLFNDGLLRMSTERYVSPTEHNMGHLYMHLTNYSINKHSENYRKDSAGVSGSKRSLRYFNEHLRRGDHDVAEIWASVTDLIIKTMIIAHPHVFHAYRMCRPAQPPGAESVCFEILGFDVLLDRKLRPWLLEVNRSPSFGTDEQLDYDIKSAVIEDAVRMLNIKARDKKKNMADEKAQAQRRLMRTSRRHGEKTERQRQKEMLERRKEELYSLLERIQRDEEREEHENRHIGRYRRIFPPIDRLSRIRYANLLANAYRIFLAGRQSQSLDLEIQRLYSCDLKEYEVRELLAQCEACEMNLQQQQHQQTSSIASLVPPISTSTQSYTDSLTSRRSKAHGIIDPEAFEKKTDRRDNDGVTISQSSRRAQTNHERKMLLKRCTSTERR